MSHFTQNRSLWRPSSQPVYWLSTEETKPNVTKANNTKTKWQKRTKANPNQP